PGRNQLEVSPVAQSLFIIIVALLLTIFTSQGPRSDPQETLPTPPPEGRVSTTDDALPAPERAKVRADRTLLREEADAGQIIAELRQGEEVEILARQDDWWHVRDQQGREGYVRSFL